MAHVSKATNFSVYLFLIIIIFLDFGQARLYSVHLVGAVIFNFTSVLLSVFCFNPVGTFARDSLSTDRSHYFSPVSLLALSTVFAVGGYSFDSVTRVSWFVCEFAGFNC